MSNQRCSIFYKRLFESAFELYSKKYKKLENETLQANQSEAVHRIYGAKHCRKYNQWKSMRSQNRQTISEKKAITLVTINVFDLLNQCDKSQYLRCH